MRRLSELISGWERPSRSSLGQLLAFARRDSVFIARKKLAGLKDWALGERSGEEEESIKVDRNAQI